MLGAVAAGAATGQVSAAEGEAAVEATKWLGLSVLGWVGTAITVGFGGALLYFRDVRLAIPTVLMLIATAGIVYFGL